jgi:hypothetical protein
MPDHAWDGCCLLLCKLQELRSQFASDLAIECDIVRNPQTV